MKTNHDFPAEEGAAFEELNRLAEQISPEPGFRAGLESSLRRLHKPPSRFHSMTRDGLQLAGLLAAMITLAVVLSWLFRSLAPVRVPAANTTSTPGIPSDIRQDGQGYEWRGTTLFMNTVLPVAPGTASVFTLKPETPATLEFARQLALRFGIQGDVYELPGELPGTTSFMVSDGRQRLDVRSDLYFSYYPDYASWYLGAATLDVEEPESQIAGFMESHGFDFPYKVAPSEFYNTYFAVPLAEDGFPFNHEHFKPSGLQFSFNQNGISAVMSGLTNFESAGSYPIRSAEEALQRVLDPGTTAGIQEGGHSTTRPFPAWHRQYPWNASITLFGWVTVYPSLTAQSPLVTLDGRTLSGNLAGMETLLDSQVIQVTGRFQSEDGSGLFEVESWQVYDGIEEGVMGMLQEQSGQVVLITPEGETLVMPDTPTGLSLPMENVFAVGVRQGDVFEWKTFDQRPMSGGGGGGGGGMGLFQLNLSGTPIAFPTPTPALPTPAVPAGSNLMQYSLEAGDTLLSIADHFSVTVEELMELNSISSPDSLMVGQVLYIPASGSLAVEGLRGILRVMRIAGTDGVEQTEYNFVANNGQSYYILEGSLEDLVAYHNRPILVWGRAAQQDGQGRLVLEVERYTIPFPDASFRIVHGLQRNETIDGQLVILMTLDDGTTYVVMDADGNQSGYPLQSDAEKDILAEVLLIPDDEFGGYPGIRVFGSAMAINPKTGKPSEIEIMADQPYAMDEAFPGDMPPLPTAAIENIELVYFVPDPRYEIADPAAGPVYIQPMWRFSGHYSNGDEFEILVQALVDEFLSPEIQPIEGPG